MVTRAREIIGMDVNKIVEELLEQNIKGKQCAIDVYQKLAEMLKEKDPITYQMVLEILEDKIEHEEKHHIEWIQVITDKGACKKFLQAGDAPEAEFTDIVGLSKVREYCNVHSLWKYEK